MLAAASGNADAVKLLLEQAARRQRDRIGQRRDRADVRRRARSRRRGPRAARARRRSGARRRRWSISPASPRPEETLQNTIRDAQNAKSAGVSGAPRPAAAPAGRRGRPRRRRRDAFVRLQRADRHAGRPDRAAFRGPSGRRAIGAGAGRARRQRQRDEPRRPRQPAADRRRSTASSTSRKYLLTHGADPNLANAGGVTPLYAVLNIEWAPRMFYPQPRAQLQQETPYLDADERAARQGRRSQRAPHAQDLVHAVQLRPARASTMAARRRSGAPPTPATSRR